MQNAGKQRMSVDPKMCPDTLQRFKLEMDTFICSWWWNWVAGLLYELHPIKSNKNNKLFSIHINTTVTWQHHKRLLIEMHNLCSNCNMDRLSQLLTTALQHTVEKLPWRKEWRTAEAAVVVEETVDNVKTCVWRTRRLPRSKRDSHSFWDAVFLQVPLNRPCVQKMADIINNSPCSC